MRSLMAQQLAGPMVSGMRRLRTSYIVHQRANCAGDAGRYLQGYLSRLRSSVCICMHLIYIYIYMYMSDVVQTCDLLLRQGSCRWLRFP